MSELSITCQKDVPLVDFPRPVWSICSHIGKVIALDDDARMFGIIS